MRRSAAVVIVTLGLFIAAPAAHAVDIGEYFSGDKPVVYGSRLVLTFCSDGGASFKLYAKESGSWKEVATAKRSRSASCTPNSPFMNKVVWDVDVLGERRNPLRYDLQLSNGLKPGQNAFLVPEYASKSALGQHYICLIRFGNDPVGRNQNC